MSELAFAATKNVHGAWLVVYGTVQITVGDDRAHARRAAAALSMNPEAVAWARLMPEQSKVRDGAACTIVAAAHGRSASDVATAASSLWDMARAALRATREDS